MTKAQAQVRPPDTELFLNRELSWLEFNARVLEEARDPSNKWLDRLRFASIVASNLDEFFMVRVAGVEHRILEGDEQADPSGMTPQALLARISELTRAMIEDLYGTLQREILPGLAKHGIRISRIGDLDPGGAARTEILFHEEILPALTPLAVDDAHPFPALANLSLNLAVHLSGVEEDGAPRLAFVQVPHVLGRLLPVAVADGECHVLIEDVIRTQLSSLFPGQRILATALFRVTRDAELELDDEGGRDYVESVQTEIRRRRRNGIVRLEIEKGANAALAADLRRRSDVSLVQVFEIPGPLDIRPLGALADRPGYEELRDAPPLPLPVPALQQGQTYMALLDSQDVVLHHPYESFDTVLGLLEEAAADPDVLAIKQTLYRTSGDSPVARALARAAENGKQVTVLIELLARFDEERNIRWANELERAGAHVLYGVRGYKTHAKILLIVKKTRLGIRRYIHLGTGNYNDRTARLYTDVALMTSDPVIGTDASAFFNALTGYSDPPRMRKLVMAPTRLRERFLQLIARERRRAEQGWDPLESTCRHASLSIL